MPLTSRTKNVLTYLFKNMIRLTRVFVASFARVGFYYFIPNEKSKKLSVLLSFRLNWPGRG